MDLGWEGSFAIRAMKKRATLRTIFLLSSFIIWCRSASPRGEQSLFHQDMLKSPVFEKISNYLESKKDEIIKEWIFLTEIPAPPGFEEKRALFLENQFKSLGLYKVRRDDSGNVIGVWPGDGSGKNIVLAAHLDTVFKDLREIKVQKTGNWLKAPGIADDTAGVINLLWTIKALKEADFKPKNSYCFIGTAKEELGCLGMREYLDKTSENIDHIIALDGSLGEVEYGALGIHGRKIIFTGPGAHTMASRSVPNPNVAVARAVARIVELEIPSTPEDRWTVLNIGQIQGGKVTNAVPQESYFSIDLRSLSQEELERVLKQTLDISERVAQESGLAFRSEVFENSKASQISGAKDSFLVQTAVSILNALGVKKISLNPAGATDACPGIEKGILSVSVGRTYSRYGHTLQEEAEIDGLFVGLKQIILLLLSLEYINP